MEVMQGWSGEVAPGNRWAKVKVTLTETDIGRLLAGANIDIAPERVPITLAWRLLDAEAERFILVKLIRAHGYPADQGKPRLLELAQETRDVLTKIREIATGDG